MMCSTLFDRNSECSIPTVKREKVTHFCDHPQSIQPSFLCAHKWLYLNKEQHGSLLQLRCLLNRCRVVFKHERKYPRGGNSLLPELPGSCVPSVEAATEQTRPRAVTTSAASRKLMGDARTHTQGSAGVISWLQWSHPDFQQLGSWILAHERVLIRNCLLSLHASVTMMGSLNFITVKSKRSSALPFIAFFMWWFTELLAPQKHNPNP